MTPAQRKWLSGYDRQTFALSTHSARECGYGDLLKAGYILNRGPEEMPDLFITTPGLLALDQYS